MRAEIEQLHADIRQIHWFMGQEGIPESVRDEVYELCDRMLDGYESTKDMKTKTCPHCRGKGKATYTRNTYYDYEETCHVCKSSGKVPDQDPKPTAEQANLTPGQDF